jgi:hypothetical protein
LIQGASLYGALFLDDFHPNRNPFKYPGFGWAILGGSRIADPFGIDDTDIILEYARVEPWTYTHKGTRQDPPMPTAYKHFNEPLGHWIGPNADDLFAQMGWQISKNIRADVSYNRIRHGEIGGSIYDAPVDYSKEKKFLGGIVEKKSIIKLGMDYTTFHKFDMNVYYKYISMKNRQKEEAKLPVSDERKQDWEQGWDTTQNEFGLEVQFRH